MPKVLDTYQQWEADGVLDERIKSIQDMVARRIIQKDIAKAMNLSENTLIKLKRSHPRLNQAFINGDDELKYKLMDALFQRAVGMEYEEVQTIIEETSSGTKKRLVKTKKKALPDFNSLKYLLIIKFGREYNERKEEIDIMLKRIEKGEETWINEHSDEETLGVVNIRKQPKK
ncbi:MAG: hypothetical protein CVV57_09690 [Tenericutes bacterium HGW-Tenericutes-2]|nr:MAG: hypothetical protein CVV57_09690 [Tenericutes bacterium HGW-Tenericutes-2]